LKLNFNLSKPWQIGLVAGLTVSLIGNAVLGLSLKSAADTKAELAGNKTKLQKQVSDLNKQLTAKAATPSASPKPSASATPVSVILTPTPVPCAGRAVASGSLKENIAAAISSKNTAALEGYMASSVNVVVAASEKSGFETPTQAVQDLSYLNAATDPWNFDLSASTMNTWIGGSYKSYISGTSFAGLAANKYVVSFDFNSCNKINLVFMSVSSDLLQ
jgi:hypothetical protein